MCIYIYLWTSFGIKVSAIRKGRLNWCFSIRITSPEIVLFGQKKIHDKVGRGEKCHLLFLYILKRYLKNQGAHGVIGYVIGNGLGNSSSNPKWDYLHFR